MEMSHEAESSYLQLDSSLECDKFNAVLLNHVGLSKYTKLAVFFSFSAQKRWGNQSSY